MRCRNCGSENEEGRYICQNCGSPLYDENEEIIESPDEQDAYPPENTEESISGKDNEKNKKSIIIIIILAVVLIAIVAGIIFAAVSSKNKEEDTTESITSSETVTTQEKTTEKKSTTEKTTKEKTTESTTESTTEKTTTTTTTTTTATYSVAVDIDGNGTVSGDGEYKAGKKATLIATADPDYEFSGWYDNSTGALVASGNRYTVTVKDNINLTAKFTKTAGAE